MSPTEHALCCLVDGGLRVPFYGRWETRIPTHDETLWLVQETLRGVAWRGMPFDALLQRAQVLHGKGSYEVPADDPWAPPWRVRPGGRVASVDAEPRC